MVPYVYMLTKLDGVDPVSYVLHAKNHLLESRLHPTKLIWMNHGSLLEQQMLKQKPQKMFYSPTYHLYH